MRWFNKSIWPTCISGKRIHTCLHMLLYIVGKLGLDAHTRTYMYVHRPIFMYILRSVPCCVVYIC